MVVEARFAINFLIVEVVHCLRVQVIVTNVDAARSFKKIFASDPRTVGASENVPRLSDWLAVLAFAD
jgi:hypothetical protein